MILIFKILCKHLRAHCVLWMIIHLSFKEQITGHKGSVIRKQSQLSIIQGQGMCSDYSHRDHRKARCWLVLWSSVDLQVCTGADSGCPEDMAFPCLGSEVLVTE